MNNNKFIEYLNITGKLDPSMNDDYYIGLIKKNEYDIDKDFFKFDKLGIYAEGSLCLLGKVIDYAKDNKLDNRDIIRFIELLYKHIYYTNVLKLVDNINKEVINVVKSIDNDLELRHMFKTIKNFEVKKDNNIFFDSNTYNIRVKVSRETEDCVMSLYDKSFNEVKSGIYCMVVDDNEIMLVDNANDYYLMDLDNYDFYVTANLELI